MQMFCLPESTPSLLSTRTSNPEGRHEPFERTSAGVLRVVREALECEDLVVAVDLHHDCARLRVHLHHRRVPVAPLETAWGREVHV